MEITRLTDKIKVYRSQVDYNKQQLLSELNLNIEINKNSKHISYEFAPGVQSYLVINSPNIDNLHKDVVNKIKQISETEQNSPYILESWVFISKSDNVHTSYHNHELNNFKPMIPTLKNEWAFAYYVQMPDILKQDEGRIFFKAEDSLSEISILPQEGDLIIFPASLLHKPGLNPNSTIDRVVVAGSFRFLSLREKYVKVEKTLF